LTGFPTETYDVDECDMDLLFSQLASSYNENVFNLLAVAICDGSSGNAEDIGLITSHCYSLLDIDLKSERIQLRDPMGQTDEQFIDGIVWISFGEFVQYFGTLIVCHSDDKYKEARQVVDISFNSETQQLSVPILKLTVPKDGNVDYLGLSQKSFGNTTQIDMSLFIVKSENETMDLPKDELFGFMPLSAQQNKYVKFGCSDEETNDISTGLAWKSEKKFEEGTYFLIPWTSGVQWSNDEQKENENKYIGLTVHGQGELNIQIVDGMQGKEINSILMAFAFKYGETKIWGDLDRRHFVNGQMDVYCGKNVCDDKKLIFSMTASEQTNVTNAAGFPSFEVNKTRDFEIGCGESVLFACNVPKDPNKSYSSAYKFALKNEYL